MSTDDPIRDDETDPPKTFDTDPKVSEGESAQAMGLFTEATEPDEHLDPTTPAFDRVQDGKAVDDAYERDYNRRYVKKHGDHHGHKPIEGPKAGRDVPRD